MSPFYTGNGDKGYTGLLGQGQFPKNDLRLEVIGAIDEANAAFGLARSWVRTEKSASIILQIQRDLYNLMAETAATSENSTKFQVIGEDHVAWIEQQISELEKNVRIPEEFIIPGDSPAGATLDVARTIVRRAERLMVGLVHQGEVRNVELLRYLNRLSSLCFVVELYENQVFGQKTPTLAKGIIPP